jgi:hypothetical protein
VKFTSSWGVTEHEGKKPEEEEENSMNRGLTDLCIPENIPRVIKLKRTDYQGTTKGGKLRRCLTLTLILQEQGVENLEEA